MPWISVEVENLLQQAKQLLNHFYQLELECPVMLCTQQEMNNRMVQEIENLPLDRQRKDRLIQHSVPEIVGKYFPAPPEIWLVEGRGDNLSDVMHELLHSIQMCNPHREGIVDYITYIVTKDESAISEYDLNNWKEIAKGTRFKEIFRRLLTEGDCEDF